MGTARNPRHVCVIFLGLGILALNMLLAARVSAQVSGATLNGIVKDESGAIIAGAQVSITNIATGVVNALVTNSDGQYSTPNLLPGTYQVTASNSGFKTEVRTGITLTVGQHQVLDMTLQVGETNQQVKVTAAPPAVELASSTIGAVVDSQTVVDLPLNGRDWTQLATLQPGVQAVLTQDPLTGTNTARITRGLGGQLTISGTRPQLNNYLLDGISIVDYAGGSPGSVLGISLGVDAVGEFSVLTANFDAEYGRTSGGVVNAVTRSGTNAFHGDAYEFNRDEDFDARNFFDSTIPPFHRNQFGGSVGGPIRKNRTFFFVDYEGLRQALGVTNVDKVPSPDARNGILHNADGSTTNVVVDPAVAPFLGFYPKPNSGLIGTGNTGHYDVAVSIPSTENFVTARVDDTISEKDSLSGTWLLDRANTNPPDLLDDLVTTDTTGRTLVTLEETHVFNPTWVNALRFGFSRVNGAENIFLRAVNPLVNDLSMGAFPGKGAPAFSVTGLTSFFGGGTSPNKDVWNTFQAYDDVTVIKGLHSIKMGFAFERMQLNKFIPTTQLGLFSFTSLANFLTNKPSTFRGGVPGTFTPRDMRQTLLGGYVQDDWRWRPNLTLNLGLRYETTTVLTETSNRISNLPTFTSVAPQLGSPFYSNPTLRNFEPRIGFSWDPFHDEKTAVRGGFGVFDVLPLPLEFAQALAAVAPFAEALGITHLPAGTFPSGAAALAAPSNLSYLSIQTSPKRNYVMVWNLNVERQLTPSTALTIGYVGNHGVHMQNRTDDVNLVLPTTTPEGLLWPFPAGSGTRLNPNVGQIIGLLWTGSSVYDALIAKISKKMSHGFQAEASYTWGKNIDSGSSSDIGDNFANSISSPLWFCSRCRRGLSDYDIGQTLVINYLWDIPAPKMSNAIGSYVLRGWEVGGIFTAESGVPFTPLIGGDPLGENSTDPWAFPDRLKGSGCGSAVNPGKPLDYIKLGCFSVPMATPSIASLCTPFASVPGSCSNLYGNAGRNSLIGPGLVDFDFSLFKNNYIPRISESFNVQLRAEFFNILNRANFAAPIDNSTLFDQTGAPVGGAGAVDATSTTAREIQFALKVIW